MSWTERAQRARQRAAEHNEVRFEAIQALFDSRSLQAHWVVPKHARTVGTAAGLVELKATSVVQRSRRITIDLDHPMTIGLGSMDGRTRIRDGQRLLAQVVSDAPGEVRFELIPESNQLGLPQSCAAEPWAQALRAVSPILHRRVHDVAPVTRSELTDRSGRIITRDERRFVRGQSRVGYGWAMDTWTIDAIDNPMPDTWLLGVLLATTLFSRGQPSQRVSRHDR